MDKGDGQRSARPHSLQSGVSLGHVGREKDMIDKNYTILVTDHGVADF